MRRFRVKNSNLLSKEKKQGKSIRNHEIDDGHQAEKHGETEK
jgi:hypothetical protein